MTTSNHDDQIEVLSVHPTREAQYFYLETPPGGEDNIRVLPPGREPPTPQTAKQKRVARIVMVMATLMILTSFLLVAVTLSMSDHIDEMVSSSQEDLSSSIRPLRKMNGLTTSPRPTLAASTTTPSPTPLPLMSNNTYS